MKENTSGRPWLISTVNMNAPAIMLCFSITKNLDSIPRIRSVRPGSLLREWIATLSRVGGLGRGDGAAVYFPVTMRTRQKHYCSRCVSPAVGIDLGVKLIFRLCSIR